MRTLKTLCSAAALTAAATAVMSTTAWAAPSDEELRAEAQDYFEPIPANPPALGDNVTTRDRVELGKMLFFDPRISLSGLLSCNSCHNIGMGGVDGLETSIGHGWQKGPRNAPTVYNAVFNEAQFWDGRAEDLEAQAKGPVQAGVEMAATPERVVELLMSMPDYVERFTAVFPNEADPVTFDNMARAIESFEATLITPHSRFDQYLSGDDNALNEQEKNGLYAFMDKGCAACHSGVNIGGVGYYPFGVIEKPGSDVLPENDHGRFAVTETAEDQYVFRAGPLRNIELTAPYFHSGNVWDLEQAVAIMSKSQLGEDLNDQDIADITAFLKTLTGEIPAIEYPVLPVSGPSTPKPVAMIPGQ